VNAALPVSLTAVSVLGFISSTGYGFPRSSTYAWGVLCQVAEGCFVDGFVVLSNLPWLSCTMAIA